MIRLACTACLMVSGLLASVGEVGVAVGLPCCLVILAGVAGLWVDWNSYHVAKAALKE